MVKKAEADSGRVVPTAGRGSFRVQGARLREAPTVLLEGLRGLGDDATAAKVVAVYTHDEDRAGRRHQT